MRITILMRTIHMTAAVAVLLGFRVVGCLPAASQSGPTGAGPSAVIEPREIPAYGSVVLRVRVRPNSTLEAGAVVGTQLPNAMLADKLSYSLTKRLQTRASVNRPAQGAGGTPGAQGAASGGGPTWDDVSVESPGNQGAVFAVEVVAREFELGTPATRHGRCVNATLKSGTLPAGAEVVFTYRTMSPWVASRSFSVYVAINGKRISPDPTFAVRPGPAVYSRVIVPSSAKPGQPFRVLLVSLDPYDNLSDTPFSNIQVAVGNTILRKGISYRGGYETTVSLPNAGIYRLTANGVTSNPIEITPPPRGPFWGELHGHNDFSFDAVSGDSQPSFCECARDVSGLDFAGLCNHYLNKAYWPQTQQLCREFNKLGQFATILAYESGFSSYHMNGYFYDCDQPGPDLGRGGCESLQKFLEGRKALLELHHTGVAWQPGAAGPNPNFDGTDHYLPQTRMSEIYSAHGESEYYDPDDALNYEHNLSAPESHSVPGPHYARDAWAGGKRFVTMASSDDHNGQPGKRFNGLAAVVTPSLDRTAILDAINEGRCYGTTGERILLDFELDGKPMGSIVQVKNGQPLRFRIAVHGTGVLDKVEVLRYVFGGGKGWETAFVRNGVGLEDFEANWTEPSAGRAVYYLRVQQKDPLAVMVPVAQERPVRAWSTPIWIESEVNR